MLERLERVPVDPILGLMAAFRADTDPHKVDLGVGVYRDAQGNTPVLGCVRRAERAVLEGQSSKTYVAAGGNAQFNQAMERLVFGPTHARVSERLRTIQGVGGCGALRVGAELMRAANRDTVVYVSTPTWANHVPLLSGSGMRLERYPYYDPATGGIRFPEMLSSLDALPAGTLVLLHASCHNPTGADLSEEQWRSVLDVVKRRRLIPFIDIAYQGLGTDPDTDAFGIRLFAPEVPELLVAASCSKNFGLYRERTGSLHMLAESAPAADAALSQAVRIARTLYSMPPDHGAAIVATILADAPLSGLWLGELSAMRARLAGLRHELVGQLREACPQRDFGFIGRQHGMFSFLGISVEEIRSLRTHHHVYMTEDSRINIAGLRADNLEYFARSVAQVLGVA